MSIKMINSLPEYITNFVSSNHEQLLKIFEDELKNNNNEFLFCNCSKKENKMDIQSINESQITQIIDINTWTSFKSKLSENNKILLIKDTDLDQHFLLYI